MPILKKNRKISSEKPTFITQEIRKEEQSEEKKENDEKQSKNK